MSGRLKVATAGTGYFSQFHYNAWQAMEDVELVAVYNRTRSQAEEFADRYSIPVVYDDFDALLAKTDLDIVDIITPPVTHPNFVRKALGKNLTVICQKPFTPSLVQAQELVADIQTAGGKVVIHENFRFQPWYNQIKSLLDANRLGDLYQVTFRLRPGDGQGPKAYLERQPYFQDMERFLVHETAVHLIDVFRYLFGDVASVSAHLSKLNPAIAGEDAGIILFDFANGTRGLFDGNRLADHAAENRRLTMGEMLIEGSKGSLRLDGDAGIYIRVHGSNEESAVNYHWDNNDFGGDCVRRFQQHVVDHLNTGTVLMNTAQDYMANLKIEEAVYQSSADGRRISFAGQGD
jgi:D-apiose dehydrogenase